MSYSIDQRQKVLVALESEPSSEVVADQFGVSGSFVRKLRARVRLTGDPAPLSPPGKARIVDPQGEEVLRALVEKRPDATLDMLLRLFPRHGGRKVSDTTIWRTLCRMGMSLKKRPSSPLSAIDRMSLPPESSSGKRKKRGTLPD